MSHSEYGGVINELVNGTWEEPGTGKQYEIPPEDIVISSNLEGREAELVKSQHAGKSIIVVSDAYTHDVLGQRVFLALQSAGIPTREFVWQTPSCSEEGVEQLRQATTGSEALIAVGSGTINDSVKYASYLDKRDYSVFPTSPMNAFTTNTASVSFGGFKRSITCHGAKGIFFDLSILANCPKRLIAAAFADVICRTTAQVDWLMSNILFNTAYSSTPYTLLSYDEDSMIDNAASIAAGDKESLAMLTRISAIMGLGTSFTETTHSGSMAEHMMSHYIDMFSGQNHPGTSHGEQVGVATITLSKLQSAILNNPEPPVMHATDIPQARLHDRYGKETATMMIEQTSIKALDEAGAEALNQRLSNEWDEIRARLLQVMLPYDRLHDSMGEAGCQRTASELGVTADFYSDAIKDARYIRDRFTMLDLAADSGQLDAFASQEH